MLRVSRISSKLRPSSCLVTAKNVISRPLCTPAEPQIPKKSKFGLFLKLFGVTGLGLGGVVGYASYDKDFRQKVEENVPYSKEALDFVYQNIPDDINLPKFNMPDLPALPSLPSVSTITSYIPFLGQKEEEKEKDLSLESIDKEAVKRESMAVKKPVPVKKETPPVVPTPKVLEKKAEEKKVEEKRPTVADIEKQMKDKEAEKAAENLAIETIVGEIIDASKTSTDKALELQEKAKNSTIQHYQLLKKAMEDSDEISGKDEQWKSVSMAFSKQKEDVENAEISANKARENLEKLKAAIAEGKSNATTKANKVLTEGQQNFNKLSYALENAIAKTKKAESSTKLINEFKDLVEKGKKQFQKELESITPEVTLGRKGKKLTEEELNSLIAHAHRRIEQLQKQLLQQQVLQHQTIDQALNRQREEDEKLTSAVVEKELEKQQGLFAIEKEVLEAENRVVFEQELRQQLSRQAAAHSDHLADVLRVQRKELEVRFDEKLADHIMDERIAFSNDMASWIARLRGIEAAVEGRAEAEKLGRKAQELWLACTSLHNAIRVGKPGATGEAALKPLTEELTAVKEAGNQHPFVNTVIESLPEEAVRRGVWTEDNLTQRFEHVRKICKRVARIDERGGSLFKYFLSYMQSFLMLDTVKALPVDAEIDPENLDTFTILASANVSLQNGDLEQAVRFMNQLKGESRQVAEDWLKEAILLLETRQAVYALIGHASANGIGTLAL